MANQPLRPERGPFRADQLRDGDRYELSNGHPIYCPPADRDQTGPNLVGAVVIGADPDVQWAGVDAGFSPEPGTLRAPDVAVAPPSDESGWIKGAPLLAVEYASAGQDESYLTAKIADLLAAGTRLIWVVRLTEPRRVEIYRPGQPPQIAGPGELLEAPGILRNAVLVEALYDRAAAHAATLRNLLQRRGYDSLEAVRNEGVAESILALLTHRGLTVAPAVRERILACRDHAQLIRWLLAAAWVEHAEGLVD